MGPNNFAFSLALAGMFAATVSANADTTLWYNGDDVDNGGGSANELSDNYGYFRVYDDFTVTGGGWQVTRLWSNNAMRVTGVTQASWELRSGVTPGNGGTIVASGVDTATQTATGRFELLDLASWNEYSISVSGLDLYLAPGTYWLNVSPIVGGDPGTDGYLNSYTTFTTGANAIGKPPGSNGNGLQDWSGSYAPFSTPGFDFSMGVAGTLVPEPSLAALVLMGSGFWAYLRKRRNSWGN